MCWTIFSFNFVNFTVALMVMPPPVLILNATFGLFWFSRIPTVSNSRSSCSLVQTRYVNTPFYTFTFSRYTRSYFCCSLFVASNIIKTISAVRATAMTCLPRPLPWEAPSIIPGKSSNWICAPLYSILPGIHVKVVNSYEAAIDSVLVNLDRRVDLPTEGNPMSATRASPDFITSKPSPYMHILLRIATD